RSPLLLVPVRLERDNIDAPWRLQAEDEDILPNHTLAQRLLADFKLRLPAVEDDSIDPDDPAWRTGFLAAVEQAIRHQPRWEVLDEAALDVVKRRLDDRGLGDFCLELHSHKTNKHDVVEELGSCLGLTPERQRGIRDDLANLAEDRAVLNDYVRALHAVRQPLGQSAFQ